MLGIHDSDRPVTEAPASPLARGALAFVIAITVAGVAFVAMTEAGVGVLVLLGLRHSPAVGFILLIYAPALDLFLIISVVAGIWTSRRFYFGPLRRPSLRAMAWTAAIIVALAGSASGLASAVMPRDDCPPLASGLYGTYAAMNDAFARRLQTRFLAGSSEGALVDELKAERFVVDPKAGRRSSTATGFLAATPGTSRGEQTKGTSSTFPARAFPRAFEHQILRVEATRSLPLASLLVSATSCHARAQGPALSLTDLKALKLFETVLQRDTLLGVCAYDAD